MKVCEVIKNSGIPIKEISKQTRIDYSILCKYRRGLRSPSIRNAKILGKFLKVDWWLLFENDDEKK